MPFFHRDSAASSSSGHSIDDPNRAHHHKVPGSHSSHSTRSSISSHSGSSVRSSRRHSLLRRMPEDPSIQAAHEQVLIAEAAEKEADKALLASKRAVKEAREHIKHLEREAAEEARLARIKQDQAKSISKRAKPLGRELNSLLANEKVSLTVT
ncbi:hypothetical protein N7523_007347 [Penicillium sp. IBT 18751x]|nr:hypothetical protein N7523_007347 [Penicillium sp. IBT 18751x]